MKSLIDILDLSVEEIDDLLSLAGDIIENPAKYSKACEGKKLATLFFEPSTRTRLSFEAAMYELGGHVIGFSDAKNTSASKGESVADTAKVISCYADIIAMRHYLEGAPMVASCNATIPVINAGMSFLFYKDGGFEIGRKLQSNLSAGPNSPVDCLSAKAATGGNPVIRTKNTVENDTFSIVFFIHCESNGIVAIRRPNTTNDARYRKRYASRFSVDIISPLGCISSRLGVYSLRLDDILARKRDILVFGRMIYNFFEIDAIQG